MKHRDLISLELSMHLAALKARDAIDAIPADASVSDEFRMIEAASAGANDIAERIAVLPVKSEQGKKVKARAQAWLDGTYWKEVA